MRVGVGVPNENSVCVVKAPTRRAVLQGWRTPPADMPARDTPIGEMFAKLATEPTIENFLMFVQFAYAFGFPSDARQSALKAIPAQ
jgi:hypothetical protein